MFLLRWYREKKKKKRLEEVRKNPYKRVDSDKMTDIEKMNKGFNGKTQLKCMRKRPHFSSVFWGSAWTSKKCSVAPHVRQDLSQNGRQLGPQSLFF